jgi:type IV pilus assembly protein PilV
MLTYTAVSIARRTSPSASGQRGSFLLEALIAILIVSFGILGIVGLQARSMNFTNDAQNRGMAVYLTDAVLANMWASASTGAIANTNFSGSPGVGYLDFQANVFALLPGASSIAANPQITIVFPSAFGLDPNSFDATVTVMWHGPSEPAGTNHSYTTTATIGRN